MARRIVAITGGIGAGKSIVCDVLRAMGFMVYDCDSRAKLLMNRSDDIKRSLYGRFGARVISNGCVNRKELASIVFDNSAHLEWLNNLVHSEVRKDIAAWVADCDGIVFVETAILYESKLDKIVDEVWNVIAPKEIRIARATKRDNSSEAEIVKRIEAQEKSVAAHPHPNVKHIVNDGCAAVLPQIIENLSASR